MVEVPVFGLDGTCGPNEDNRCSGNEKGLQLQHQSVKICRDQIKYGHANQGLVCVRS